MFSRTIEFFVTFIHTNNILFTEEWYVYLISGQYQELQTTPLRSNSHKFKNTASYTVYNKMKKKE